jgi:hypothetical protein
LLWKDVYEGFLSFYFGGLFVKNFLSHGCGKMALEDYGKMEDF